MASNRLTYERMNAAIEAAFKAGYEVGASLKPYDKAMGEFKASDYDPVKRDSGARVSSGKKEASRELCEEAYDMGKCMVRDWNGGWGCQCQNEVSEDGLCKRHYNRYMKEKGKTEGWQFPHGLYNEERPTHDLNKPERRHAWKDQGKVERVSTKQKVGEMRKELIEKYGVDESQLKDSEGKWVKKGEVEKMLAEKRESGVVVEKAPVEKVKKKRGRKKKVEEVENEIGAGVGLGGQAEEEAEVVSVVKTLIDTVEEQQEEDSVENPNWENESMVPQLKQDLELEEDIAELEELDLQGVEYQFNPKTKEIYNEAGEIMGLVVDLKTEEVAWVSEEAKAYHEEQKDESDEDDESDEETDEEEEDSI